MDLAAVVSYYKVKSDLLVFVATLVWHPSELTVKLEGDRSTSRISQIWCVGNTIARDRSVFTERGV